jgi:hypothetical protein
MSFSKTIHAIVAMLLVGAATLMTGCNMMAMGKGFDSCQDAVETLTDAIRDGDLAKAKEILGPEGDEILNSGDATLDKNNRELFLSKFDEKYMLEIRPDNSVVLLVGENEWPMPIPLVRCPVTGQWYFDVKEGKEEMLNRRVGKNELDTIQVCLAYVDAQREYSTMDPEKLGGGKDIYAQKLISDAGRKNGLYWPAKEGETESPLGDGFAKATQEGYVFVPGKLNAFHGYYYRILKAQGESAPGGAMDYVVDGKLTKGFALIAWPAEYGNSGVMTFIVNQTGIVYSADLGKGTDQIVPTITTFNPDARFSVVKDVDVVIGK